VHVPSLVDAGFSADWCMSTSIPSCATGV
jgi:hypothetical protein